VVADLPEAQEPVSKAMERAGKRTAGTAAATAQVKADESAAAVTDILAIIPAHNEASRIAAVVSAVVAHGLPVLVVDDGSTDETAGEARAAGAQVLVLQPNRGKGAALKEGFREALGGGSTEVAKAPPEILRLPASARAGILTLDGDGQHDPAEVPAFLEAWKSTGADLVIGARDYRDMPPVRWFTNSVSRRLFSWALGQDIPDNQSGYRLRSRRVAEASLSSAEVGFAFEVEEIAICAGRGYKLAWVPIRTIYGTEVSDIKPWSHFMGFMRVTWRVRGRAHRERQKT
jgi:glycosyltransferase involved in cell wall biosynthesis